MAEIGTKALESTNSSGGADNSGGASGVAQEDTRMEGVETKALESANSSSSTDNSGGASNVAQEDTHMEGVETNETKALEGASNPGSANSSDNANSGGTPQDESEDKIKTYTPDEKKNEVLRILRWPEWAYYEILELPLDANDAHVKTAFRNKSKLTHTDRNDDVDAKKVFQRVNEAYKVLSNTNERKAYDVKRQKYISEGLLVQKEFDEVFAESAYKKDNDDDDDDDDAEVDEPAPMSKEKEAILKEMAPEVRKAFKSYKAVKPTLEMLNKKMMAQNKEDEQFVTSHCIPIAFIEKTGKQYRTLLKITRKEAESDADIRKIQDAEKELKELKERVKQHMDNIELPRDWTFDLPETRKFDSQGTRDRSRSNQGSQANNGSQGQTPRKPNASSSNDGTGSDPMDVDPKSTDISVKWKPGETVNGEKILGYRFIERWVEECGSGRLVQTGYADYFVIRVGGKNPIELVTAVHVGYDAVKAYLALPEEQKNNISGINSKYGRQDKKSIRKILGFARSKEHLTPAGHLPFTVVQVEFNDGTCKEERLLNRSTLRKVLSAQWADEWIKDFIKAVGEPREELKSERLSLKVKDTERRRAIEEARENGSRAQLIRGRGVPRLEGARRPSNSFISDTDDSSTGRIAKNRTQNSGSSYVTNSEMNVILETFAGGIMEQMQKMQSQMQQLTLSIASQQEMAGSA